MNWHFDHSKGRTIKGINILNALYHVNDVSVPVAFEIIHKPIFYCDIKTRKVKRESNVTKNDLLRNILTTCQRNQLNYKYVLTDIWYASTENMQYIKIKIKKNFVMAMKSNRLVALTLEDKKQGNFVRIDSLPLEEGTTQLVYLKGLNFTVQLTKQVFKNKDDSEGILYLVSSDINLTSDQIITIYQKRWNVFEDKVFFQKTLSSKGFP